MFHWHSLIATCPDVDSGSCCPAGWAERLNWNLLSCPFPILGLCSEHQGGPSPTLGPGASLPLNLLSWPQPSSGMLAVQWYISSSGQFRGPERPTARSLKALTWGQVQLVERFELLCEVSMVHPTCGTRQGRETCLARRLQGHCRPCPHTLPVGANGDSTLWEGLVLPQPGL